MAVDRKTGNAIAPACWSCGDKAMSLRPGVPLLFLVKCYRGDLPEAEEDPQFAEDMNLALKNVTEMATGELEAKDLFTPNGQVLERHSYGIRVYQTYALVTQAEYTQLAEHSPLDLGKKAFNLPFNGPLANIQFFLLDLKDLDPAVAQAVRKVDITYSTQAELEQLFLHADQQIHQKQPWKVFQHRVSKHFDKRPDPLRPAAKRPDTLEQVQELFLLNRAPKVGETELAEKEKFTAPPEDGRKLGLEEDEEEPGKSKRRRATPSSSAGKRLLISTTSEPAFASHHADVALRGDSPGRSHSMKSSLKPSKTKDKKGQKDVDFEDADMKSVAEAHLGTSTGTSARSLATLASPELFLNPEEEASLKSQSNAISAVQSPEVYA